MGFLGGWGGSMRSSHCFGGPRVFQMVPKSTLLRIIFQGTGVEKMGWFEKETHFLWGEIHASDDPRIFRRWSEVTTNSDMLLHWRYPNVEIPSCWMSADVSVKEKEYLHLINSSSNFPFRWILRRLRGFILFCQQLRLSIADSNWIFHGW